MKKQIEMTDMNSTLRKADDDEMLFILRAQDKTAPKVILHWIAKNFETASENKLRDAFNCALQMKEHKFRKLPD